MTADLHARSTQFPCLSHHISPGPAHLHLVLFLTSHYSTFLQPIHPFNPTININDSCSDSLFSSCTFSHQLPIHRVLLIYTTVFVFSLSLTSEVTPHRFGRIATSHLHPPSSSYALSSIISVRPCRPTTMAPSIISHQVSHHIQRRRTITMVADRGELPAFRHPKTPTVSSEGYEA